MSGRMLSWLRKEIRLPLLPLEKRPTPLWVKRVSQGIAVLFWLIAAWFAIWRICLHREINQRFASIRSAGFPVSGQELNLWRPEIRDSENAALVLTQAFVLLQTPPGKEPNEIVKSASLDRRTPWTSIIYKTVAEYVELNANALTMARVAIQRPHARFATDLSYGPATELPHLDKLKELSRLVALKAVLEANNGSTDEWVEAIRFMLKLGSPLDKEPVLLSYLVRNGIIRMAVKTTERCLNATSPDNKACNQLVKSFLSMEKTNVFASALMGERAMFIPVFRLSWSEIQRSGKMGEEGIPASPRQRYSGKANSVLWLTGLFDRDLNVYRQVMETNIPLAALAPPQKLLATHFMALIGEDRSSQTYPLAGLILTSLTKTFLRDAATQAHIRLVQTGVGIERFRILHGHPPEVLQELFPQFLEAVPADPFAGAPLRYRPLHPGYVVYSIDADGHDDGGREIPAAGKKSSDRGSYDIPFTVER